MHNRIPILLSLFNCAPPPSCAFLGDVVGKKKQRYCNFFDSFVVVRVSPKFISVRFQLQILQYSLPYTCSSMLLLLVGRTCRACTPFLQYPFGLQTCNYLPREEEGCYTFCSWMTTCLHFVLFDMSVHSQWISLE
jgi:hypothetical protein